MLRTRFIAPAAALTEGWQRAHDFLDGLVRTALKGGRGGGGFTDAPLTREACRAAVELLAQGDREGAKDLIRALARARELGDLVPGLVGALEGLVREFRAWTADEEFLGRYQAGLGGMDTFLSARIPPQEAATDHEGLTVVTDVCGRLWGLWPDAPAATLQMAPRLQDGWDGMALLGLRIGTTTADLRFQRNTTGYLLRTSRAHGPRLRLGVRLEHLAPTGIWLDDEPLGAQRAVFDLAGEHDVRIDL